MYIVLTIFSIYIIGLLTTPIVMVYLNGINIARGQKRYTEDLFVICALLWIIIAPTMLMVWFNDWLENVAYTKECKKIEKEKEKERLANKVEEILSEFN